MLNYEATPLPLKGSKGPFIKKLGYTLNVYLLTMSCSEQAIRQA